MYLNMTKVLKKEQGYSPGIKPDSIFNLIRG